jgi:hypothetical protein
MNQLQIPFDLILYCVRFFRTETFTTDHCLTKNNLGRHFLAVMTALVSLPMFCYLIYE